MWVLSRHSAIGAGLVVAILGTALASPAAAAVTVIYVGGTGCTDGGSGTQTQPYCTINKAASVAAAGQTVLVATGTYTEKVTVAHSGSAGSPIVFQPATGAAVTVTGAANGFALSGRSYVTISGFAVTGTSSYGISAGSSSNLIISGNTVTYSGHPASGQIAAGIYLSSTTNSLVTGNTADHNSNHGIYVSTGSTGNTVSYNEASWNANGYQRNANGIDVIASSNTIIGNVLHDNEDSGLQFYPGGNNNLATLNVSYNNGDHGIDDYNVTGGRLIGNTIYHNCTSGINVEGTSGSYLVENNIAVDNAVYPAYNGIACSRRNGNIGIWDSAPATTTVDANVVYLSTPGTMYVFGSPYSSLAAMKSATGQEQHGKQANPNFASTSGSDFRLTEGSPAIDAANSGASGEQGSDILGTSRMDDPTVADTGIGPRTYDDMGAYEYQSTGTAQPPTAVLSITPANGTAPLAVTADASASTDPQGQSLTYTFAFGDGTTIGPQATATAAHTYTNPGTYTATLTVTDTSTLSATTTKTVTVTTAAQPPTAVLSITPANGTAPLAVTADASASTDPQSQSLTYTFAFGDGTTIGPQATATAAHTYTNPGTYTATLTVTDTSTLSATTTKTVTVTTAAQAPTAVLSITPANGTAPLAVTADASASTDPQGQSLTYTFAFGDGTTIGPQATATAAHTYTNPGTYTATLTVTDTSTLSATTTKTVTVTTAAQAPTAVLSITPANGTAPLAVTADASASTDPQSQSLTYTFAFGDGTTIGPQATATATHTYTNPGTYTATLTVTDTSTLSATTTKTVTVTSAGGNPTFVGQIATNYSTNTHTSGSITVWQTRGVAAGDLEVITVALTGTTGGPVSGSDDAGNTLTVARDVMDGNGNRMIVLYGLVHTALVPNNKVIVSFPSATTYRITGDEVAGVSVVDQTAAATGTGTSFASGSTGTTTAAKEFIFGAVADFAGSAPAWAGGWSAETSYAVGSNYLGRAYRITSAPGTFTASGTASGAWLAVCVTFE